MQVFYMRKESKARSGEWGPQKMHDKEGLRKVTAKHMFSDLAIK